MWVKKGIPWLLLALEDDESEPVYRNTWMIRIRTNGSVIGLEVIESRNIYVPEDLTH
jgi:hypothetical protein